MKFVTYESNDQARLGALVGEEIIDLRRAFAALAHQDPTAVFPEDMIGLLADGEAGLAKAKTAVEYALSDEAKEDNLRVAAADATLMPPITRPGKIICLGRNYAAHAAEGGAEPPPYPMLFYKPATSLLGDGGTIVVPAITERPDYEGELAVIIGKTCKNVSEEEALDYVGGYAVAMDITARDLQRRTSQFTAGKMLDTFGPLGPALVTADEVPDPSNLTLKTVLNGNVMQDDTTANMIFTVPFTIHYISQIATLEVGDIILTGTPEGVGYPRKPPVFLQNGDIISVEIEKIGKLTNHVQR
ncbi:MAG: fumarylacetoacetate hydrolase family protein [Chloroflexota bacterium]